MAITLEVLERWLHAPTENEHLEFKEAKQQFDSVKLMRYIVALANEGGGHLVLGVADSPRPRRVVGSLAYVSPIDLGSMKSKVVDKLGIRVESTELVHADGRVLVITIPSRPQGTPLSHDGSFLMRVGQELVPMTPDHLRRIFAEGQPDWLSEAAASELPADEVVALLDTQGLFELLRLPYPATRDGVMDRLESERLVFSKPEGWCITRRGAVLLAKRLDAFPSDVARKAPRVVIYEGGNKLHTRDDKTGQRGYAVGFEALVEYVHTAAPQNRFIEEAVRQEVKMFPKQALRELIANALVHQDFNISGAGVMIEMFSDRVEITNPGLPPIEVPRFIDEYRSRNEQLADLMRRLGICEEKGSGVDKVVEAAEYFQLPAPDFRTGSLRTTAVLFAHQEFKDMSRSDRIRACYQHCCLLYVSNKRMSNQSLRDRFRLGENKAAQVSQIIGFTKDEALIKPDDSETTSTRYARYLPFWA